MDQVRYSNLKQNRWSVLRLLFVVVVLTAVVLQVAPTRATAPYDDEFNSTSLAGIWSWVRQDSANWSLSAVPGSMRITCQAGEINNANTTAENLLLQAAPAGDWTATAKVTGKPTANWAQVALLAYQDDNNWVKVDRVFDSGNKFQVGREAAGAYTFTTVTDSIASTTSYLRLVKSGTTYTAFYSADDVTYTQIGAAQTITLSNIKIGLSCYGGTGISGAFDWIHVSTAGSPPTNTVTNTPIVPTHTRTNTPPPGTAIRIEAGNTASFTDNGGNVWAADHSFVAGSGGIADRGAIAIANTLDDKLYQTERWGATGYNVTIPNGTYNVNLHFAETSPAITGAGQRIFNVNVEGQALNGLDVFAQAGGKNIALIKSFNSVTVTDGVLTITLTASVQATEINGIEIVPGVPTPTITPGGPTLTMTNTPTRTPTPGGNLVWSDEFDGPSINTSNWGYEIGYIRNNELQYYTNRPENARIENGALVIEARKENYNGYAYTSASLNTQGKRSWQYGRIEMRAKLPYGQGIWPAFWMMGISGSWPANGEIDIMEMVGGTAGGDNRSYGTIHWENGGHQQVGSNYVLPSGKFADDYHIFAIQWTSTTITWYVDSVAYFTTNISSSAMSELRQPQFILLNLAVGGSWPGPPNGSTVFPQKYYIDYVRVYQP